LHHGPLASFDSFIESKEHHLTECCKYSLFVCHETNDGVWLRQKDATVDNKQKWFRVVPVRPVVSKGNEFGAKELTPLLTEEKAREYVESWRKAGWICDVFAVDDEGKPV
jgi:hypothetical protein